MTRLFPLGIGALALTLVGPAAWSQDLFSEPAWSLAAMAGPYQPSATEASVGFTVNVTLRHRFSAVLANDLGLGWADYTLETTSEAGTGTEGIHLFSLYDAAVVFLSPDAPYVPYLLAGPGGWLRYATGRRPSGAPRVRLTPGGKGGAGILLRGEGIGLNLSASYVVPDFARADEGALEYGLAIGLGF